jgi:hypothetical protein
MQMSFGDSRLEVEALLTWFPTRSNAVLKEVRMRSVTIKHTTSEGVFQAGNRAGLMIGQGLAPGEDSLAPGGAVRAFVEVGLDDHMNFELDWELDLGGARTTKLLRVLPGTRTPFMMNLKALETEEGLTGSAAVLQGVITTTQPFGLASLAVQVSDAVTKLRAGG